MFVMRQVQAARAPTRARAGAAAPPLHLAPRCAASAAAAAAGSSPGHASPSPLPSSELVRRARQLYEDAWSQGDVRLLDKIMAEEHVQRDMIWQPDNTGGGRRRLKRGILAYRAAYPDIKFTVQHAAAVEGDRKVFVSWHAAGTNLGPIHDQPPSGRTVAFSGVTLVTFDEEGRIVESAVYRQAPADEARYFSAAPPANGSPATQHAANSSSNSSSSGAGGA